MAPHDSVISSSWGTKSACVLADTRSFAKSGVLGMFQRRFLYQTMLLLCGCLVWVITVGSPQLCCSPSPQRATQRVGNGAVLQIHAPLVPILLWMCRLKCPDREVSSQPPWPAIFNTEFLTLSGYTKSAEGSCVSSMWRESSLHSLDTKNSLLQLSSQFGEIKDSPGFLISIFTRVSFPHCFCITKCTVAKYHPYVLQLKGSKLLSNLLPSELLTETTLTQQRSLVCVRRDVAHLRKETAVQQEIKAHSL